MLVEEGARAGLDVPALLEAAHREEDHEQRGRNQKQREESEQGLGQRGRLQARLVARGLMACGVERGERVALWATNVPEWVTLQFALAKIGAILVTVNTSLRGPEIDYLLRQSESATVITIRGFRDVDYVGALREIGAVGDVKLPKLKRAIFIGRGEDDECPEGLTPYE